MKRIPILILLPLLPFSLFASHSYQQVESLLQELDREIAISETYFSVRERAIDSAKVVFSADTTSSEAAFAVGRLYAPYQCDSALVWYARAECLAGARLTGEQHHDYERLIGRKEGILVPYPADSVFPIECTHQFAINAGERGNKLLEAGDTLEAIEWLTRSAITDVKLGITDNGSIWKLAKLLSEQDGPNVVRAYDYIEYSCRNEDIYHSRLRYMQIGPVAHEIASKFRTMLGEEFQALRKAFIAIAIIAVLLLVSILLLIIYLKKLKRVNREVKSFNQQLDQANKELDTACKALDARNRELDTANKELDETNKELDTTCKELDAANKELDTANKELDAAVRELDKRNKELCEMNEIREHFICSYLEDKSAEIRQLYKQSQKAGSANAADKFRLQLEDFYRSFDTTFLRLYPNFVDQINSLLRVDAQIDVPKGTLTHELRIFALIRLGITRSTRISELLCLSPNTIYNYRSRLKNLAVGNRDEFEDTVRNL